LPMKIASAMSGENQLGYSILFPTHLPNA
jgi:hypothetical protein